jgi:vancomycin resistance protein YoaR
LTIKHNPNIIYLRYLSDRFLPGVRVAGISIQGCTEAEAEELLEDFFDQAYNIPVIFSASDYSYSISMGDITQEVDVKHLLEEVKQKERERSLISKLKNLKGKHNYDYPALIDYEQDQKEDLSTIWNQVLGKEAIDAKLDMDPIQGLIVVPEETGKIVDVKATFEQLPQQWEGLEAVKVQIVMADQKPEVVAQDLEYMGELASYVTWYKVAEVNRTHNLTQAAQAINAYVLRPGKVFSFNNTVGPRTLSTGFRDAPVIVGNTLEPGMGGGICQVSSTLYNACLLAGLEIVERSNHGLAVSYVPLGMDATVAYGLIDYRFRNNTDYPVYIRSLAGGGKLMVNIYGHMQYKQNIKTSHVVDEIIPFVYRDEIDTKLKPGESRVNHKGFPGYVVRSFRTYYNEAGEVIKSELLAKDRYKPFDEITYVGPPDPQQSENTPPADEPKDPEDDPDESNDEENPDPPEEGEDTEKEDRETESKPIEDQPGNEV